MEFYTEDEVRSLIPKLCQILHKAHGSPNWNNKQDPIDEIIYIILSTKTEYTKFNMTYESFKEKFSKYSLAAAAPENQIFECIKLGGLGDKKAKQIKKILLQLQKDNPAFERGFFESMPDFDLEKYLCSLHGIGLKSARCVMMYSLGRKVLPVDIHTLRVSKRIGIVPSDMSFAKADKTLQDLVPPDLRYCFHVNMVAHGKKYCRKSRAKCSECPLNDYSKKNIELF